MKLDTPQAAAAILREHATEQMAVAILSDSYELLARIEAEPDLLPLAAVKALTSYRASYAMAYAGRETLSFTQHDRELSSRLRQAVGLVDGFLLDTLLISDAAEASLMRQG